VHVAQQFHRIAVGFHEVRLEAALKEVPTAPVAMIEADGIGRLQPADPPAQVAAGCLDQKMIVVGHETEGMDTQGVLLDRLSQRGQELPPIHIVAKDLAPFVATRRYVIHCPGEIRLGSDGP